MKTDKDDLLALILRGAHTPARSHTETVHERAQVHSDFKVWLQALESHLPSPTDPELDGYYHDALMGLVVGFGDRNLSPYLEQHTAVIAPMLDDIRVVYAQIQASGLAYSPEEFVYRAFDYGIHKAYYLDWDLYLSKDMY